MSKDAETIEKARKLFVQAMGTPLEGAAKKYLEAVLENVKARQRS